MNTGTLRAIKQYLHLADSDMGRVRSLGYFVIPFIDDIVEAFYTEIAQQEEARAVFTGGETQIAVQKLVFAGWLRSLFDVKLDAAYLQRRVAIGSSHVKAAVPQHLMITGIHTVWREVERRVLDSTMPEAREALRSFHKLLMLELALMLDSYTEQYIEHMRKKERIAVEEKLTRAEHLAKIGQLAASLAHEIKNPLAGISGAIQIMRDAMKEEDPHHGVVSEILGQIKRLDATVKDLLQYARPVPPRKVGFFLGEAVADILKVMREEPALREVAISLHYCEKDIDVYADRAQIEQLLINLLLNAGHACEDGGRIKLTLGGDEDHAELVVEDDGSGMSPSVREEAFEAFFTTKARGTGLGLPICRRIAEEHGGWIRLDSELKKGTTVTVRWPRRALPDGREEKS